MDAEEKKERKAPLVLIIFSLLALSIGGLWAAHFIGLVNLAPFVAGIPYVNQVVKDPYGSAMETVKEKEEEEPPTTSPPMMNPLEVENRELRAKLLEMEQDMMAQAVLYERQKTETLQENTDLKAKVQELEVYRSQTESQSTEVSKTAEYLQGMKPDAIVKVMDNLDDDTVIQIFELLPEATVSKVLALMDPERAAVITRMLLG
jgi:flagellar motility protein MotE (MotC chaperone)